MSTIAGMNDEQLRRIDALIAEHVMGWKLVRVPVSYGLNARTLKPYSEYYKPRNVDPLDWRPTTDANACAEMRKRLREMGKHEEFALSLTFELSTILLVGRDNDEMIYADDVFDLIDASPLQQCLAALKATGVA